MRSAIGLLAMTALVFTVDYASAESASRGQASYYGYTGRTASGEMTRHGEMTAAHRTLPFGTRVRVTHARNGKSVVVRINDRGPFIRGRIIDVSHAAAGELGMLGSGVAQVEIEVMR